MLYRGRVQPRRRTPVLGIAIVVMGAGVIVFATAVPPSDADLIVVRGATPGQINVVMNQDDIVSTYQLVWPDTVMRLLPRQRVGNWEESSERPPAIL